MINLTPQQFVTWDEPIEMLYACHSKVKNFCRQLQILPDYLEKNGCNVVVENDVKQILNYFNQSAPLHHDDEEQDFFPALVKQIPAAQRDIDLLEKQHIDLHQNWERLSEQLNDLLLGKCHTIDRALIKQFVEGYDVHIAIEEPLFELGRVHLAEAELHSMGKIMAKRREV